MQDFRNIRRSFVLNKAMTKFNKHNYTHLKESTLYLLYCLCMLNAENEYVSARLMLKTMGFNKRNVYYTNMKNDLVDLEKDGYLTNRRSGSFVHYKLTVQAINMLSSFETCLRKERWNR